MAPCHSGTRPPHRSERDGMLLRMQQHSRSSIASVNAQSREQGDIRGASDTAGRYEKRATIHQRPVDNALRKRKNAPSAHVHTQSLALTGGLAQTQRVPQYDSQAAGTPSQSSTGRRQTPGASHWRAGNSQERSEERRVGKECRSRWEPDHEKKKKREARGR